MEAKLNIFNAMRNYQEKALQITKNYANGAKTNTITGERYILCDNATSDSGKSTVLAAVADYFLSNPSIFQILDNKIYVLDRWAVVREISTGKVILVQTKGDIEGCYSKTLTYMLNKRNPMVDIIVCACHPNDSTHLLVETLAGKSFKLYYFSNFAIYKKPWIQPASTIVKNQLKDSIINIVKQL